MEPGGGNGAGPQPLRTAVPIPFGEIDDRSDQVMVPMRDGVRLATDVYVTKGRPAPVILVRLPYDKSGSFSFMPAVAGYVVDRGYCFVAQDVRGKIRSEGTTFAFTSEVRDGADTLEWIASQPWCDGSVVMFGDSYYGFTQWAAAASGHPALKAIVPRNTASEIGTDWMYHQGVFCLETMLGWGADTWMGNPMYEFPGGIDWSHRPLSDVISAMFEGRTSASVEAWRSLPPTDPFWTRGIFGGVDPSVLRIPALHTGGWWDVFRRGQMRDFQRASRGGAPGQHLLFEQSDHYDDVLMPDGAWVGDYLEDPSLLGALLPSYLEPALAFYDHYVRGMGSLPPPARWRLANAEMRTSASWPPEGVRTTEWFLGDAAAAPVGPEGGMLLAEPETSQARVRWLHDPHDPVPGLIADVWRPLLGLPDEREVEVRSDVVTFTSEPMGEPLDIAGAVSASLVAGSSARSMHIMTKLVDVFPGGRARRITEGACLVTGAHEAQAVSVNMSDIGYRLDPGHRLRLEVAGSEFPRYILHPGSEEDPWRASEGEPVEHRIEVGGSTGSRLRLQALG